MLLCSGDKEVSGISYRHKNKQAILASQSMAVLALQRCENFWKNDNDRGYFGLTAKLLSASLQQTFRNYTIRKKINRSNLNHKGEVQAEKQVWKFWSPSLYDYNKSFHKISFL